MANTYAMYALRSKRARLAGELEQTERRAASQREALATIDAVIRMFEPTGNPDLIPAIRPHAKCRLVGDLSGGWR